MTASFSFIVLTVALALIFDFINGFHDAANSIATVVSTRVLKPHWAVIWAAFFNFIAFLVFKLNVADTIGTGIIDPSVIDPWVIFAALCGAIIWNLLTWYYKLPSSSTHALIGAILGAGIIKAGPQYIIFSGLTKILIAIVISPLLGMILGLGMMFLTVKIFFKMSRHKADNLFRKLQLISAALISLGHGGNDAQKTMGIIALLLFSGNLLGSEFYVPLWVVVSCNFVIAVGTLFGGWRIVKTMGMRITKLTPIHGFCAETSTAFTLALATHLGIPVSTTHTITGSIIGVGSLYKFSAIRWGLATSIVWAWILTIPAAAFMAGGIWLIMHILFNI
jgi:PiT family inorganic phosphate transporter